MASDYSIRVTNTLGIVLEGTLFVADPITNMLAINTAPPPPTPSSPATANTPGDYHIMPINKVAEFKVISPAPSSGAENEKAGGMGSFEAAVPRISAVDLRALRNREMNRIEAEKKKILRVGKGVTAEGQAIFDLLSRT
jgi:hypothetical protein